MLYMASVYAEGVANPKAQGVEGESTPPPLPMAVMDLKLSVRLQ